MELSLLEAFALADDRSEAVRRLIPGTEEHSFLRCLLHQQRGELVDARKLLDGWSHRQHFRNMLLARQLILEASPPDARGWEALKKGEKFDHRCQLPGKTPPLPGRFPEATVARKEVLRKATLGGPGAVADLSLRGLEQLLDDGDLSQPIRHKALERLTLPRHPKLIDHVVADLGSKPAKNFGSLPLHQRLTLGQLDQLLGRVPELLQSDVFVSAYLTRLDADPEGPADDEARLARHLTFVERLPQAFAQRQTGALYRRIELRWKRGQADREGLLRYLKLTAPPSSEGRGRETLAEGGHSEALLLAVLQACLVDGADDFKGLLAGSFLRQKQAEAMLLAGAQEAEQWGRYLEPAQLRALEERVDLELAPTNPQRLGADDDVAIELDVKNIDALVVRIFQIDTVSHFRARGGDVGVDLDLDGFVPNHERRVPLGQPPVVRHRLRVPVPEAKGPGTYVVDLVGGGLSCRALIRKGSLRALERVGAAGHVLTVLDERGQPVQGATAWLGGRAFEAEPEGRIVIPFTTGQGSRTILLQRGEVTSLQSVSLRGEAYQLEASFHVEREDLIPGAEARLLIRARLTASGGLASPTLLESLRLTVAGSREGITTERTYDDLKPSDRGEMLVTFTVPEGLDSLQFTLSGELLDTRGARVPVSASGGVHGEGFRATSQITSLHLLDEPEGWGLLVLGRAGEPVAGAHVSVELRHVLGGEPITMTLQSDDEGRVRLGKLPGVAHLQASLDDGEARRGWALRRFACAYPSTLHLRAGQPLRLPIDDSDPEEARYASLFSGNNAMLIHDLSARLRVEGGVLSVEGLPAGQYVLTLPGVEQSMAIHVASGEAAGGWLVEGERYLSPAQRPPAVLSASVEQESLKLRVEGASSRARVHVFATTLAQPLPALALYSLAQPAAVALGAQGNLYSSVRTLGDEARYILDRRHAARRPGNMLPRPGLLLNPWAVSETTTAAEKLREGDRMFAAAARAPSPAMGAAGYGGGGERGAGEQAPDLDFLPRPSLVLANLTPDAEGVVAVPLSALEGRGVVRALLVDGDTHLARQIAVAPLALKPRDLRVKSALDPSVSYALRGQVTVLQAGQELALGGAKYRAYDTLEKAWALLESLDPQRRCTRFDFLKRWATLDDDQKQKHYSDSACHELHFYLYRKDRPFFDRVIAPYLAHKRHLTFLDRYLLGHDLSAYRAPHAYERLNALERALLAERLGELDEEHRAQRDWLDAHRPDHSTHERLFRAALSADALDEEATSEAGELDDEASGEADDKPRRGGTVSDSKQRSKGAPASKKKAAAMKMAKRDISREEVEEEDEEEPPEAADQLERLVLREEQETTRDVGRRAANRQLYQPLDATREYAEQHYYRQRLQSITHGLAPTNPFWRDLAAHRGQGPFLSPNFIYCTDGPAAMLLALAVLDLPTGAGAHALRRDGASGLVLAAASPAIVFHEQIKPATASSAATVMVAQHYLRAGDDGEARPVSGELLVGQPYRCQVIVSNPAPDDRQIDLLLQLPEGSLPLSGARPTRSERLRLGPYETRTLDYSFYFPHPGAFRHHPAQASEDGQALAAAPARSLSVVRTPSQIDHDAWPHLSQAGTSDEVIEALSTRNLHTIRLDQMAWRLHDRAFYDRALATLERRRHYDATAWSYSLLHRDPPRAAEYLRRRAAAMALAVEAPWLSIDPQAEGWYEHLDYAPLVNPRAHGPAGPQKILNRRLAEQVERLLVYLCSKATPDDDDRVSFVYYLLLQDRVEQAAALFARVDAAKIRGKVQHDYLRAYLAFFDDPARARAIATPYAEYPVDRWRDRFREVLAQLDEIEGHAPAPADPTDRDQRQAHLAATAPALELRAEGDRLRLHHRHAPRCEVRFYQMDLELLFSQRPFSLQTFGERPSMRPNHALVVEPGPGEGVIEVEVPEALRGRPLLIEATCGEARATAALTAGALAVQVTEAYGQLRVCHASTGAPLPRVYVKVYAQEPSGRQRFHKDGYTDLRGRFDYVSVSGADAPPQRFALLLLSDQHGAALREASPPTR